MISIVYAETLINDKRIHLINDFIIINFRLSFSHPTIQSE